MSKNILIEHINSKFQVLENKPANVLKRIKGVLSDFRQNRNDRVYPKELWENVLNSDYVREMIDNHSLVGELDHPEDRLEISLQNVSHVINDMWLEDDKVMGVIDILPTPSGKIVNELLDYGTNIGISSRGAGSVSSDNVVDSDYQFITFDFVARPSCEQARLNTILEGVKTDIENNSDEKVNKILDSYKSTVNESVNIKKQLKDYLKSIGLSQEDLYSKTGKHFEDIKTDKDFKDLVGELKSTIHHDSKTDKIVNKVVKESIVLTEAMSDQDVYRVVLNWFKEQVEASNMSLNQAYNLLSDKAKVSLNKLVNQDKITESFTSRKVKSILESAKDNIKHGEETIKVDTTILPVVDMSISSREDNITKIVKDSMEEFDEDNSNYTGFEKRYEKLHFQIERDVVVKAREIIEETLKKALPSVSVEPTDEYNNKLMVFKVSYDVQEFEKLKNDIGSKVKLHEGTTAEQFSELIMYYLNTKTDFNFDENTDKLWGYVLDDLI